LPIDPKRQGEGGTGVAKTFFGAVRRFMRSLNVTDWPVMAAKWLSTAQSKSINGGRPNAVYRVVETEDEE
jgi:hypothetical protein